MSCDDLKEKINEDKSNLDKMYLLKKMMLSDNLTMHNILRKIIR